MKTQESNEKTITLSVTVVTLSVLLLAASLELMNASPIPKLSWIIIFFGWLGLLILLRARIPKNLALSLALCICAWQWGIRSLFRHPVLQWVESVTLPATLPVNQSEKWEILPFYFSMAAWPLEFEQESVSYRVPYEKGPPDRFLGHIEVFWKMPKIKVIFEGPKTPSLFQDRWTGEKLPREVIHTCLTEVASLFTLRFHCLEMREEMLLRHTREIQAELVGNARISGAVGAEWKMEWLNIANPVIPAAQQAQGILITAETKSNAIQRWILITERGSHQSIQLSYSKEDLNAAQHAQDTFRKSPVI